MVGLDGRELHQSVQAQHQIPNGWEFGPRPGSLYMLAAPSTPPEARIEIIERAEGGARITVAETKTAIAKRKPEPKQPKPKKYINPAAAALFANQDQLEAFAAVMRTPGARRFITFEQ